jgi:hypothetical protein
LSGCWPGGAPPLSQAAFAGACHGCRLAHPHPHCTPRFSRTRHPPAPRSYASRARAITNTPTVNSAHRRAELGALRKENDGLREQLAAMQMQVRWWNLKDASLSAANLLRSRPWHFSQMPLLPV